MSGYAKVIIDISHEKVDRAFTYAIPGELKDRISEGVKVRIPFGKSDKERMGYVVELTDDPSYDPSRIKKIEAVEGNAVAADERMIALAAWIKNNYGGTMTKALKTVLPVKKKISHLTRRTVVLSSSKERALEYMSLCEHRKYMARARLLGALLKEPRIPYEVVTGKLNISSAVIKGLEEAGYILTEKTNELRNPVESSSYNEKPPELNPEQKEICDGIIKDFDEGRHDTCLIHGVTGSGKTLIYMELIAHAASMGKASIMLIPEIALTYQTVMRFYGRFKDRVSFLHSKMSEGERYDQYLRARDGEIDVIIGPRSALFTPFKDIGFIIIDEEHEGAYRSESVPKYDARGVATELARLCDATLVLGSATPSVESYYAARRGQFKLYELPQRANGKPLPKARIVDMRSELKEGNRSAISNELRKAISKRLENKEQTMLFINRRGMAGFVTCRSCGYVVKCPHCDVSLKEHRGGKLICHYCDYSMPYIRTCPECGSAAVRGFKGGTQMLEDITQKLFPRAKILRMDADTTRNKDGHEKILSAFANNEADILIGTQMIVKGHDFPNVTLVGVAAADISLYSPDYKAAEKTFQLLTQAAGRAGRGSKKGEVIIQTYSPEHYSIESAATQDYASFYEKEIFYRKTMGYPPVSHMESVLISARKEDCCENAAKALKDVFAKYESEKLRIMGPSSPPIAKINDTYRRIIYIKSATRAALIKLKDIGEDRIKEDSVYSGCSVQFEIN